MLAGEGAPEAHEAAAIAGQIGIDLAAPDARPRAAASGAARRSSARWRQSPTCCCSTSRPTTSTSARSTGSRNGSGASRARSSSISHDRTFLARLTKSCLWLDRGTVRRAEIGFGGFDAWTEAVYAEEERAADKLDAKLKLELHWLQRGVTARRKRNQGRLAKLQRNARARARRCSGRPGAAKLGLARDDVKTKVVIDAEHVVQERSASATDHHSDFSLRITRGDRIGLVGANGAGKTTLLKLLTGEIAPDEGKVTLAKTLDGIVIDQQRKLMSPEKRVRDVLAEGGDWIDVRGVKKHIKGYLKEYLFDPSLTEAPVGTLSGGERSRLLLAREFARASNLLVLDEPTNDLDLETLDLLQEVIADYDGTVLIVSHDRDFLDNTVTVTLGLDGSGKVDIVAGGYEDWVRQRDDQRRSPAKAGRRAPRRQRQALRDSGLRRGTRNLAYKDQRDLDRLPGEIERHRSARSPPTRPRSTTPTSTRKTPRASPR